jgi:phosphoribosylanthranilate isomerase
MSAPLVKICGLTRVEDATAAARAGADYLGMIASPGFGRSAPGFLGPAIAEATGLPVVAVVVNEPLDRLGTLARETAATVLQLHGDETPEMLRAIRDEGSWVLWKGLRVRSAREVEKALQDFGPVADGILLDGWHPEHRGGSGARFPWDVVEPMRDRFPAGVAFIAAGGLNAGNVEEVVERLRPDVVDVSSGVEAERGLKDPGLVRDFIENAKRARH